jgi:hypothetical protein
MRSNAMTEPNRPPTNPPRDLEATAQELVRKAWLKSVVGAELLKRVEKWAKEQGGPVLEPEEAVRRLIERGLSQ